MIPTVEPMPVAPSTTFPPSPLARKSPNGGEEKRGVVAPKAGAGATPSFYIEEPSQSQTYINALVYGPPGVGKTTLAGTAAEVEPMRDVLYLDAEAGGLSLRGMQVHRVRITSFRQFADVEAFLRLHCRYRDDGDIDRLARLQQQYMPGATMGEVLKFQTVVIDSLSEVQKYCMYQLLGVRVGEQRLDADFPQIQGPEWNADAEMMRLLVRSFRDLPLHTIFVAAEQIKEDATKRQLRSPELPGKLSRQVQGFFDVVGYYPSPTTDAETNLEIRRLYIVPGNTYDAKNRFQSADRYIENPTMRSIYALANPTA